MAGFSHPRQERSPGRVVAPRQRGDGEVVGATDIPPIRCDSPDELQTRSGLQRGRPTARAGGIEAGLFVLLGNPSFAVRIRGRCGASSIPCHAPFITERSLSGSAASAPDPELVAFHYSR